MNEGVQDLLRQDPDTFEWLLLLALDHDKDIWFKASEVMCKDKHKNWVNDFTSRPRYIVYRAQYAWRETTSGAPFAPVTDGGYYSGILQLAQLLPPIITFEAGMEALKEYEEVKKKYTPDDAIAITRDVWRTWLANRKTVKLMEHYSIGGADIQHTLRNITNMVQQVNKEEENINTMDVGWKQLRATKEKAVPRRPLGYDFEKLNAALGGGLGRGEYYLGVIPTGGGKTTLCSQLAASVASSGGNVLYITTEQTPKELEPRILSYMSYKLKVPIPFRYIKDGLTEEVLENLTRDQRDVMEVIDHRIEDHLYFGNWTTGRPFADVEGFIEANQKKLKGKGENIDLILVDWLGGTLVSQASDAGQLRLMLQGASDSLAVWSRRYEVPILSMAQASREGIDVAKVTERHLADCKLMHRNATVAFGISALRKAVKDGGEDTVYEDKQYIYIFKARKSEGKYWPITRKFDYQMFKGL